MIPWTRLKFRDIARSSPEFTVSQILEVIPSQSQRRTNMPTTLTKPEPRAIRVWDPFRIAREEMESLWSQLIGEPTERPFKGRMLPSLDLSETPNTLEVRMDMPGMKAEEIDIQLNNGILTMSGERKEEKEEKGKTFHHIEGRDGSFSRSVTLPAAVAEDKVDAQYHDGVLTITLQKTEEAKSRKIKVKG
jgi:HSP20 family protein